MKFWPFLLRELNKRKRFALLFTLVLGSGLSSFLLVEALRASVSRSLASNSRSILSADLSVSLRRPFTAAENRKIEKILADHPFTRSVEFYTMLGKGKQSLLILVKSVDAGYPLFGQLQATPSFEGKVGAQLSAEQPSIFVNAEVLRELGASVGEMLNLGGSNFLLKGAIQADPTQSFRAFALGGRAYIGQRHLERTKLIRAGSTATWSYLAQTSSESEAEKILTRIREAFPSPEMRVSTAKDAGESSLRALSYLGDFLGLVSLVALLLSSLGASYLYRFYLEKRKQEIAIYRCLGVSLPMIQAQATIQTVILAVLSLIPATALTLLLIPVLEKLINQWGNANLELRLFPESFFPILVLCLFGTPLLLLSELLVLKKFAPLDLFHEQERDTMRRPWLHHLPSVLLFCALAPLVARSFRTAGIFLGLLAGSMVILFVFFRVFSKLLNLKRARRWTIRHAFIFISRRQRSSITVFLTLSLGSLLIQLLPQLESSIRTELEAPTHLPSLFFFDIQQEQKDLLEKSLAQRGLHLSSISPLVRARISAINGKAFVRETEATSFRTREDEMSSQFRNRGVNLSFREKLQESEQVIKGAPLPSRWDGISMPAVSIETRFAERLGVKIGDVLRFEIQGTEVEGKIVNERKVRWTSFQPNFFLVFQDGVLNDAPLSYLANLAAVPKEEKVKLRAVLAEKFPNISTVDVAAAIEKALDFLARMRLALLLLAGLALTAGLSVLASILGLEARERAQTLLLYRALGASETDLRWILLAESSVICGIAISLGALGSILVTYGLSTFIFDGAFSIAWKPLVLASLALFGIALMVSWIASRTMVLKNPLSLLRGE